MNIICCCCCRQPTWFDRFADQSDELVDKQRAVLAGRRQVGERLLVFARHTLVLHEREHETDREQALQLRVVHLAAYLIEKR